MAVEVELFADDDQGYLAWLDQNPDGHVLNCHKRPYPDYCDLSLCCGIKSSQINPTSKITDSRHALSVESSFCWD